MTTTNKKQAKVFNNVDADIQRSTFDLGHKNKMTANFNKMYPSLVMETMPGDSFHFSTDYFSRWLALSAPVFCEYNIKINNFFTPLTQLWGGFQQFIADGDDQSSDFLLPNGEKTDYKIPYFTTRSLGRYLVNSLLRLRTEFEVSKLCMCFGDSLHKYKFKLLAIPTLFKEVNANPSERLMKYTGHTDVFFGIFVAPSNDYVNEMIDRGFFFDLRYNMDDNGDYGYSAVEFGKWFYNLYSDEIGAKFAFCYKGFNAEKLNLPDGLSLFPDLDEKFLPITNHNTAAGYVYPVMRDLYNANKHSDVYPWKNYLTPMNFCDITLIDASDTSKGGYLHLRQQFGEPCGYPFSLLEEEKPEGITWGDIYDRQFTQWMICNIMGHGTLSDYIGNCRSNTLLRQPFEVAKKILNIDHSERESKGAYGTYNKDSMRYEVGIVNDEPIEILKYLGYHACWSSRLRDQRYELRFAYCDPYVSPFRRSDTEGKYIQGDVMPLIVDPINTARYGLLNSPSASAVDYIDVFGREDGLRSALKAQNVWTVGGIYSVLELRDRRIVQDLFTLMAPQPQYGEEQIVKVDGESQGIGVRALRLMTRLQQFFEKNGVPGVGSDYAKQLLAHYAEKPQACQHCEVTYLGGDKYTPTCSPVTMTAQSNEQQVTGQQSAQLYSSASTSKVNFKAHEHGYIFQLITVVNDWMTIGGETPQRISKWDFAFPEFANLGMQGVPLKRVVLTDGTPNVDGVDFNPNLTFSYAPRYYDFKTRLDECHGDFRASLSYFVTTRQFNPSLLNGSFGLGIRHNVPELGSQFLYEHPNYDAFDYNGEEYHHALFDIQHHIIVSRELPMLPSPNVL